MSGLIGVVGGVGFRATDIWSRISRFRCKRKGVECGVRLVLELLVKLGRICGVCGLFCSWLYDNVSDRKSVV